MILRLLTTAAAMAFVMTTPIAMADSKHGGHGSSDSHSAGAPSEAKKAVRVIHVTMNEADGKMVFAPSAIEVRKDEQVKFMLHNDGQLDHEFVLGTEAENRKHGEAMKKNPDMEHDDPNSLKLAPKKTGDLHWKFDKAGQFEFVCLIPGHRESGMVGTISVK